MTPWRQRSSQDLSWQQPEPTVILPRALQGTESEHRTQSCLVSGGSGGWRLALWGLTSGHFGPSWLLSSFSHGNLGEWTELSHFANG